MLAAGVPQWLSRSIPHQVRWQSIVEELDNKGCAPVWYPSVLATTFQFCEQLQWSSSPLSAGIYALMSIPPPDMWACQPSWKTSMPTTHCLESSPIFNGCSSWHAQESHSFPFIHPREVFLDWHWVIARPSSSCGIVLLSLLLGVDLTGVGLVHLSCTWWTLTHRGTPASDAVRRSQLQCRTCEFPHFCVMIWCTTSWGLSYHLSLNLSLPLKGVCLD